MYFLSFLIALMMALSSHIEQVIVEHSPMVEPAPIVESFVGTASHYHPRFEGGRLGCGFSPAMSQWQDGRYRAEDATIAATAWNRVDGRAFLCGTLLTVSGPSGTIVVESVDACPGCRVTDIDLSQAGFLAVCGPLSIGRCAVEVRVHAK